MGLLETIFFRNWPRPRHSGDRHDLTLDLARGALGAFRLGVPVQLLKERLGPPVSWHHLRKSGRWLYPELGIIFESARDRIDAFSVITRRPEWSSFQKWQNIWRPWAGTLRFPDGFKTCTKDIRLAAFLEHAGRPTNQEQEEEDVLLQYSDSPKFRHIAFDVEFTLQGDLISLYLWSCASKQTA